MQIIVDRKRKPFYVLIMIETTKTLRRVKVRMIGRTVYGLLIEELKNAVRIRLGTGDVIALHTKDPDWYYC